MAAGVLVVATPIGGIPQLVLDGETGILCAGTTVPDIADGIRRAAALDDAARSRGVEAARRVARVELHPNRTANDLMTMYMTAIETHGARRRAVGEGGEPSPPAASAPPTIVQVVGAPPLDYVSLARAQAYGLAARFDRLSVIEVLLGSPLEAPVHGRLAFEIASRSGPVLRRGQSPFTVTGAAGRWLRLDFDPIEHSAGQPLVLRLRLEGSPAADVGIFETHHARSLRERAELRFGLGGTRSFAYAKLVYAR